MSKLKIFCTSINYYRIIDNLPKYIFPLGLGKKKFPSNWLDEKVGKNISNLNSYYGELTGVYWIWKNQIPKMSDKDMIGICHYRKLWLNDNYSKKQKLSFSSLYSQLLKPEENNIKDLESIQIQPIVFKNKNLLEDFKEIHNSNILEECLEFLENKHKKLFLNHLKENIFYPLNMFITKVNLFDEYCNVLFPWLEKCLDLCLKKKLCNDYNVRLPAFLAERFTSYWFSQYLKKKNLSYARLGKVFLSNTLNNFINPTKIPLTFRMYPTIHRY